jgi:hypothetical protein
VRLGALTPFLAAAALTVPAAATAAAPVPAGFVGMNLSTPLYPPTISGVNLSQQLDDMAASGVQTIRVVFDWSSAQPYASWSQVPAAARSEFVDEHGIPTRFAQIDQLVSLAAGYGLRILPTVMYAPSWDSINPTTWALPVPKNDGPYAAFCAALVRRYGPHGTFWVTNTPAMPIHMWQIWNEPNLRYFWPLKPFQRSYVTLLHAAHGAIVGADPHALVVLGGLPDYSWVSLRAIYEIPGAGRWFDVVAAHPYTKQPSGVIVILRRVRRVMDRFGHQHEPIIADELSWSSSAGRASRSGGVADIETTQAGQARDVSTLLPLLAKNRQALDLAGFDYYTWAGLDDLGGSLFDFSGLVHLSRDGATTAKPAYYSFRRAALGLEGQRR